MRKIINLLLEELTENLVKSHTRKPSRQQRSGRPDRSEKTTQLDRKLKELAKAFTGNKRLTPKKSHTLEPPTLPHNDAYWMALSTWYREQKNWTCERCRLNLRKDKQYLDTHHMLGRGHNSPEHLKALCVGCHAEQKTPSDHSFMKNDRRYWQFVRTYRNRR